MVDINSMQNKVWDVVIVGSGFAGTIAHALGKAWKARSSSSRPARGCRPTSTSIWSGSIRPRPRCLKVRTSPRALRRQGAGRPGHRERRGRPTVLSLNPAGGFGDWTDPKQSYLIQTGPRPFSSTYDRLAGGTVHWLGTSLRFVPNDFKMKSQYGQLPTGRAKSTTTSSKASIADKGKRSSAYRPTRTTRSFCIKISGPIRCRRSRSRRPGQGRQRGMRCHDG